MRIALATAGETQLVEDVAAEITAVVGENLRRLRTRQGLSLERLAKASGVSRAMLGQIELGRSAPTINVLWKIARSLDVPLTVFVSQGTESDISILRVHRSKWVNNPSGRFSTRLLSPTETVCREELAEVRLSPKSIEEEDGHAAGTTEYVVVIKGTLEIRTNKTWHQLDKGDTAQFAADRPHAYRNPGLEEAIFFMIKIHPALRN